MMTHFLSSGYPQTLSLPANLDREGSTVLPLALQFQQGNEASFLFLHAFPY
jgi:hypothetical protein